MAYKFNEIITNGFLDLNDDSKRIVLSANDASSNTTTTLRFPSSVDRTISFPDVSDSLVASGDNRFVTPNVIIVKKSDAGIGEYTSIAAAVNSIVDSSSNNSYVVRVGPGVYTEPLIIVPSYVAVVGSAMLETIVEPDGPHHVFSMGTITNISFMTIQNAQTGYAGIACIDNGIFGLVHKITMYNNDTHILVTSVTQDTECYLEYVDINGIYTHGIVVESNNGFKAFLNAENYYTFPDANPSIEDQFSGTGTNWEIDINVGISNGLGTEKAIKAIGTGILNILSYQISGADTAIFLQDGADCEIANLSITNCRTGIISDISGSGPNLVVGNVIFSDCSNNLLIDNSGTTGRFIGFTDYEKTHINPNSTFAIESIDRRVIVVSQTGGDYTTIGEAIGAINPEITITTTDLSTTITSTGLFTADFNGISITGTGIPASTTATFIDINTMTLSNPATADGTITATFIRATVQTPYLVQVNPGLYIETNTITIPSNVTIEGVDRTVCFVVPAGNFNLFESNLHTAVKGITIQGVNATKFGVVMTDVGKGSSVINCIFSNCPKAIYISNTSTQCGIIIQDIIIISTIPMSDVITIRNDISGILLQTTMNDITITGVFNNCVVVSGEYAITSLINCVLNGITNIGNGINIQDGGSCYTTSVVFKDMNNAIIVSDQIANNPTLEGNALFRNNTVDLNIKNRTTEGKFNKSSVFEKIIINPFSTFYLIGTDRRIITVAEKGGDFTSINDAITSINTSLTITTTNLSTNITSSALFTADLDGVLITGTGIPSNTTITFVDENNATLSNAAIASGTITGTFVKATKNSTYLISVSAGNFIENDLVIPNYVSLVGTDSTTSIIEASDPSGTLITMSSNTSIRQLNIKGGSAGIGILVDSVVNVDIQYSKITHGYIGIKFLASSDITRCTLYDITLKNITENNIFADGTLINSIDTIIVSSSDLKCQISNSNTIACKYIGPYTQVLNNGSILDISGSLTGTVGFDIYDGAEVTITGCDIREFNTGIIVENIGDPPNITFSAIEVHDAGTYSINIEHPGTFGVISAIAEKSKIFIDPASTVSVEYLDPVVNGKVIVGDLFIGHNNAKIAEVSELIKDTPPMGVIYGGEITINSGLIVDVSGGYGYLTIGSEPTDILKKYTWSADSLTLPATATSYIYVDQSGSIVYNSSKPSTISNIFLGRIRTDVSSIEFIEESPEKIYHQGNYLGNYLRDVFGGIYVSGSIVMANASREIAISSGKYYYSLNEYNPDGATSPASFDVFYHDASGNFTKSENQTIIDNTQYDGSGGLVALTTSYYTKHTLYIVSNRLTEKYMLITGQNEYAVQGDAESASLAIPPSYFTEGVIPIASIIVQEGNATFTSIISERPLPSFNASSVSSTINHGSLLGLLSDDHVQYLLTDGTRALAGDLNIGGFSITNVNLVDGVDVSAHASRHLPNGADPLTTSIASTLNATTSGATGTANSLARSDHVHAITTGNASQLTPDLTGATGSSSALARADHIHNIPTATPVSIGSTNNQGVASSFARSDHIHQGVHSITVEVGGTARYNSITFIGTTMVSIIDNGGTFTFIGTTNMNNIWVNGATFGTIGVTGTASLLGGVTASNIVTGGLTANGITAVGGITALSTLQVGGLARFLAGVTANNITTGGLTANGITAVGGITALSTLQVGGLASFLAGVTANNITTGGLTANGFTAVGGITALSTLQVGGLASFLAGVTANNITTGGLTVNGFTANNLASFVGGITANNITTGGLTANGFTAVGGITALSTLQVGGLASFLAGITANNITTGGLTANGITAINLASFIGGITANNITTGGLTANGITAISGITALSTLNVGGLASFLAGVTANNITTGGLTANGITSVGGITALSTLQVGGLASFLAGVTANNITTGGLTANGFTAINLASFIGGITANNITTGGLTANGITAVDGVTARSTLNVGGLASFLAGITANNITTGGLTANGFTAVGGITALSTLQVGGLASFLAGITANNITTGGLTANGFTAINLASFIGGVTANNITTGGLTANGITAVGGITAISTLNVGGLASFLSGVTANNITTGGLTANGFTAVGGITALSTIQVGGLASFLAGVTANNITTGGLTATDFTVINLTSFNGGITASNITTGGLTANGFTAVGGITALSTLNVGGLASFLAGITANNITTGGLTANGFTAIGGITALSTLNVSGLASFLAGVTSNNITTGGLTTNGFTAINLASFVGGITANNITTGGLTANGFTAVGGITALSTLQVGGLASFLAGVTANNITTGGLTANGFTAVGGITALSTLQVGGLASFLAGITANNITTGGLTANGFTAINLASFIGGITANNITTGGLTANGFTAVGGITALSTLQVGGLASFLAGVTSNNITTGGLTANGITAVGGVTARSTLNVGGLASFLAGITADNITVGGLTANGITAIGGVTARSTLNVGGLASFLAGVTANNITTGGLTANGFTAVGGITALSTLQVGGLASFLAGVTANNITTGGLTANGFTAVGGITALSTLQVGGLASFISGVTANNITTGGLTANGFTAVGGITALSTLQVGGLASFLAGVTANNITVGGLTANNFTVINLTSFNGGITASNITTGGLTANGFTAVGGITALSTLNVGGLASFLAGITANNITTGGLTANGITAVGGITALSTLQVGGLASFLAGVTANNITTGGLTANGFTAVGGITALSTLQVGGLASFLAGITANNITTGGLTANGFTAINLASFIGGITANNITTGGLTANGITAVGGITALSTLQVGGLASFLAGITANNITTGGLTANGFTAINLASFIGGITANNITTGGLTANGFTAVGGITALSTLQVGGLASFLAGITANNITTGGLTANGFTAVGGITALSTLQVGGLASFLAGVTANNITTGGLTANGFTAVGGITALSTLQVGGLASFLAGVTANNITTGGLTANGFTAVGGVTARSTLNVGGLASFLAGITADNITVGGLTANGITAVGGVTARSTLNVTGLSSLLGGVTTASVITAGLTSTAGVTITSTLNVSSGIVGVTMHKFVITDSKTSGSAGGAAVATTWTTRTLNTITAYPTGSTYVSLASNRITLLPGDYLIQGSSPYYRTGAVKTILYNVTAGVTSAIGTSEQSGNVNNSSTTRSNINYVASVGVTTSFEIQYYAAVARAADGLGIAGGAGLNEIYSMFTISKLTSH